MPTGDSEGPDMETKPVFPYKGGREKTHSTLQSLTSDLG